VDVQNFFRILNKIKSMISFISIGRNDNYGGNFLNTLLRSLNHNLQEINSKTQDFEYILVDWVSTKEPLYTLPEFQTLLNTYPQFKIYTVDSSVALQEGLSTEFLYEYFAKNVGIRKSKGELISVLNSDLLLSSDLISNIIELSKNEPLPYVFRPKFSVAIKVDSDLEKVVSNLEVYPIKDLGNHLDENCNFVGEGLYDTKFGVIDLEDRNIDPMGEIASGDMITSYAIHLKDLIKGYDETNPEHRQTTKRQSGMDSEIIYNYVSRGMPVYYFENLYFHVEHSRKDLNRDGVRKLNIWSNPSNWGLEAYPEKLVNDNVYLIYN
jgi:hypothetical protein